VFDDKLEPILWQFPCSNSMQRGFEAFLAMRPWDRLAAREFVSGHDQSDHVAYWAIGHHPKLRHTIEVRHGSFVDLPFIHLLRRYAAVVVPDCTGHWPCIEDMRPISFICTCTAPEASTPARTSGPALQH
jgi:uncharacterized protein YecE (DUF72 family)